MYHIRSRRSRAGPLRLCALLLACAIVLVEGAAAAPRPGQRSDAVLGTVLDGLSGLYASGGILSDMCRFQCASGAAPAADPLWPPSYNGCGTADTFTLVPGFKFTPCCNDHDLCYSTCGRSKSDCDATFLSCMLSQCTEAGSVAPVANEVADLGSTFPVMSLAALVRTIAISSRDAPLLSEAGVPENTNWTLPDLERYDTSSHDIVVFHRNFTGNSVTAVRKRRRSCPTEARLLHVVVGRFGCDAYLDSQEQACLCG